MYVGSLFSGIGGIELGFERQGFKTVWFVENNLYAQTILRKHWPNVPIYGDIKAIDFKTLPKVEVITGGFPCQDISNAGKRKGIEGEKSSLWKEYLRAISEIQPKFAFIENVSALRNRGLETVLGDLASIGYDAEWHCVPASALGALHRRDRIYILAYPSSTRRWNREESKYEGEEITQRGIVENSSSNRSNARNRNNEYCTKEKEEYSDKSIGTSQTISHCDSNKWESTNRKPGAISENLANPDSKQFSGSEQHCIEEGKPQEEISRGSNIVANPSSGRLEGPIEIGWDGTDARRESYIRRKEELRKKNQEETWKSDAGILRVANGIPNRVDRIKCCGNAVVPQVAEFFAEIIK